MKLEVIKDMFCNLKENKMVQGFIKELSEYLESSIRNNFQNQGTQELPIIESILKENRLTTGNENAIRFNEKNTILEYAKENESNEPMYFVKDNKKVYWQNNKRQYNPEVYTVFKLQDGEIEEMEINKQDMPKDIQVNDVFRSQNGEYVVDVVATKELQEAIKHMANQVIEKQENNLEKYRKEGHEYLVTEELGNSRFLKDITQDSKTEFEEVDMPEDILEKATEGTILRYIDGRYVTKMNKIQ